MSWRLAVQWPEMDLPEMPLVQYSLGWLGGSQIFQIFGLEPPYSVHVQFLYGSRQGVPGHRGTAWASWRTFSPTSPWLRPLRGVRSWCLPISLFCIPSVCSCDGFKNHGSTLGTNAVPFGAVPLRILAWLWARHAILRILARLWGLAPSPSGPRF